MENSNTPDLIFAPFTPEQVQALNVWQRLGYTHPYTCVSCEGVLIAETGGWRCEAAECTYTQNWAHTFSADQTKHPADPRTHLKGWV